MTSRRSKALNLALATSIALGFALWLAGLFNSLWVLASVGGILGAFGVLVLGPLATTEAMVARQRRVHDVLAEVAPIPEDLVKMDLAGARDRSSGAAWSVSGLLVGLLALIILPEAWLIPVTIGLALTSCGFLGFGLHRLARGLESRAHYRLRLAHPTV